jgi:hypothetical protein
VVEQVGPHQLDPRDQVTEALGVRLGFAPDDPCDLIPLVEQQPCEQRPVLSADACDERAPRAHGRITRVRHAEESTR